MKKKIANILLTSFLCCFVSLGCSNSSAENNEKIKQLLINSTWKHYNAIIGETEGISFTQNNEFFYNCSCGEPVGDSDLYDTYSYDGKDNIVLKASYDDGPNEQILHILFIDDMTLLLDLGDDIVEFYNEEKITQCLNANYEETCDNCMIYLEEYDGYSAILELTNKEAVIAPADYDGDTADLFKDYKRNVELSENIEFYSLSIESAFKDEERIRHDCTYKQLTTDEVTKMFEYGCNWALTWYNKDGQITKMLFYGTTAVYE